MSRSTVQARSSRLRIKSIAKQNLAYMFWNLKRTHVRQYGGQSGSKIGTRTLQHAGDIDNGADKPVPNHFQSTGSTRADLRVTPFLRVKSNNPYVRLHLERLFINTHHLIEDGINVNL